MLSRWNNAIEDLNLLLKEARIFVRRVVPKEHGKGRPPKKTRIQQKAIWA